jgi:hypothetical protein
MNTGDGSDLPVIMGAKVARAALGLPEENVAGALPVPGGELAALAGVKFDSDDGSVENFERGGKLHFRLAGGLAEGVLLRQAENAYAVDKNTEVHFVVSGGRAAWAMVYVGGFFLDAKYRVP